MVKKEGNEGKGIHGIFKKVVIIMNQAIHDQRDKNKKFFENKEIGHLFWNLWHFLKVC